MAAAAIQAGTMQGALVLRPEPGNAATAARLDAAGFAVQRQPLFAVVPLAWQPPDPADFDALLLTSANAVRHAGPGLARLAALPVLAVGEATAAAARAAGLAVALVGDRDAADIVARARTAGFARALHLAGRDRVEVPGIVAVPVYASAAIDLPDGAALAWRGWAALLHSPRAARRFAAIVARDGADRGTIAVVALSPAVRAELGDGWAATAVAERPGDAALIAAAAPLIDPPRAGVDKPFR